MLPLSALREITESPTGAFQFPIFSMTHAIHELPRACLPPSPYSLCLNCTVLPSPRDQNGRLTLTSDSASLRYNLQRISQTPLQLASVPRDAKATSKES